MSNTLGERDQVTAERGERDERHRVALDSAQPTLVLGASPMPDLAPTIHRQRLIIEGLCDDPISAAEICEYLQLLSEVCGMRVLTEPVTHRSDRYGWAGWIHWETSGAHFYAWEEPHCFFSVDLYTCKAFDPLAAIDFTAAFFRTRRVVAKAY
jgi:S-adenosylmethionine/arginine decarboxylase-like enzyme